MCTGVSWETCKTQLLGQWWGGGVWEPPFLTASGLWFTLWASKTFRLLKCAHFGCTRIWTATLLYPWAVTSVLVAGPGVRGVDKGFYIPSSSTEFWDLSKWRGKQASRTSHKIYCYWLLNDISCLWEEGPHFLIRCKSLQRQSQRMFWICFAFTLLFL